VQQSCVPMAGQSSAVTWECDCLAHRFANAADNGTRQRRYPTDMTDGEWARVLPLLPVPGWMRGRGGRPEGYCGGDRGTARHGGFVVPGRGG